VKSKLTEFSQQTLQQIRFAEGWLGLGNAEEAGKAIADLNSVEANQPDVLALRWSIHAAVEQWEEAHRVALIQLKVNSDDVRGWINQSYALRRMPDGGIRMAMEALLPALQKFPREVLIPYNLACYQCQLGDLEESRKYLRLAFKIGGRRQLLALALDDPDLKPIRDDLGSL
jgi:tetratricopeptide (TPR) repeat protein